MVYAALNVVLAGYAVVAFIGLRNSMVDLWIHGTVAALPVHRARRMGCRSADAPGGGTHARPTGGPCLSLAYAEPQSSRPGARPADELADGPSAGRASPPRAARRPPRCPRWRRGAGSSLVRVLTALVVLAGVGYGGYYAGIKRSCSPRSRCYPPDLVRAVRRRHAAPRRTSSRARPPTRPGRACSASWSPPRAGRARRAGAPPTRWPRPTRRWR